MNENVTRLRHLILQFDPEGLPEKQQVIINQILALANSIATEVEGVNALAKSMQAYSDFYTNLSDQMAQNQQRFEDSAERFLNLSIKRKQEENLKLVDGTGKSS